MPIVAGYLELLDQPLYDTETIPPEHCRVNLFANPIGRTYMVGSLAYSKSDQHTNMYQANMLPAPQRFIIERLGCLFLHRNQPIPITGDHKSKIWYTTILQLQINVRWYWRGPAWMIADMAGVIGSTKAMEILRQPDHNRLLDLLQPKLAEPIPIEQQQIFGVDATVYDPLYVPVELFVYLRGRMARSVI